MNASKLFLYNRRDPLAQILCNQRGRRASNHSMQIVESQTLETECLPFSSIPHTTRLFDDFLHNFDQVKQFYARPPLSQEWWAEEIQKIQYPAERRQAVAAVLERQNREFGAGKKPWPIFSGCARALRRW